MTPHFRTVDTDSSLAGPTETPGYSWEMEGRAGRSGESGEDDGWAQARRAGVCP